MEKPASSTMKTNANTYERMPSFSPCLTDPSVMIEIAMVAIPKIISSAESFVAPDGRNAEPYAATIATVDTVSPDSAARLCTMTGLYSDYRPS